MEENRWQPQKNVECYVLMCYSKTPKTLKIKLSVEFITNYKTPFFHQELCFHLSKFEVNFWNVAKKEKKSRN